jgi:hypothetical protein
MAPEAELPPTDLAEWVTMIMGESPETMKVHIAIA